MTSGRGPSSRIEPARTTSTPTLTHSNMIPNFNTPNSTALFMPPSLRIVLMAWRWCRGHARAALPFGDRDAQTRARAAAHVVDGQRYRRTESGSNRRGINWATWPDEPVWTIAGPPTRSTFSLRTGLRIESATPKSGGPWFLGSKRSEPHEAEQICAACRSFRADTPTPSWPTTIGRPGVTSVIATQRAVSPHDRWRSRKSISWSATSSQCPPNRTWVRWFVVL